MTFKTDRPFFPYREPADQRETKEPKAGDRLLRVFLLSSSRMEGTLGGAGSSVWPGKTVWAGRFHGAENEAFNRLVPSNGKAPGAWLTVFEDKSSPRPGTDEVYFAPSNQPGTVELPPIIRTSAQSIPVPLDLMLMLIGGLILMVRWKRGRIQLKDRA